MKFDNWAKYLLVGFIAIIVGGCNKVPDYVIPPDKMAELLSDIHIGESVVETNSREYSGDSLKKVLKQSIYAKHGVSAEQVDTSLVWYGHNIEEYIKVYDLVIERIEGELENTDVASDGTKVQIAAVGDSVDTWSDARRRNFTIMQPSEYLKFTFKRDENWERGDLYTWKMKMFNGRSPMYITLAVEYTDGSNDFVTKSVSQEGWIDVQLPTDSAKVARTLFGVVKLTPKRFESAYIDSISLVRERHSHKNKVIQVQQYNNGKKKKADKEK